MIFVLALVAGLAAGSARAQETSLTSAERAKLDTFEGVSIDKADKIFAAMEWPRAVAEYDAFIVQFPESKVTPYAILRKGRALQETQKRFEALRVYQDVLDFFPDDVKYAAAANYRIGECHMQSGDVPKAMKSWFDLSEDAEYVKEPLGAAAINGLAENLVKQGKADDGIKRYEQVAVEFRTKNPEAAMAAIAKVMPYHIRTKPDNKKLRDFYVVVKTFEHGPRAPGADVAADADYWTVVRNAIKEHSKFTDVQKDDRDAFYRYWAGQFQAALPTNDDQQIASANYIRVYERDEAAWAQRLDKQFADHQKEGDFRRIGRWVGLFAADRGKADEYYRKLDFAKMSNADILALIYEIVENNGDAGLAGNTFGKLKLAEMPDGEKQKICDWMRDRPQLPATRDLAVRACLGFNDAAKGKMAALRYLHWRCHPHHSFRSEKDNSEGLAIAGEMQKVPETAKEAHLLAGNLLQWSGKHEEAINSYRQADSPPQTLFWTAECLAKLGKLEPAVSQLKEVENFFKDRAPEAALALAYLYRDAAIKEKYVRSVRGVIKKYPKSGQSSEAHQRLEEMGLPIGGGVDAEE